ncbi:MAG: nucleotide exchange factor GrpE [Clostridiales Family XIII bacterium]|jgi:molecular chaperone GrpE|nr:nucleotide exchange factor GrpE [Clostridiales Family XIII bacterium]
MSKDKSYLGDKKVKQPSVDEVAQETASEILDDDAAYEDAAYNEAQDKACDAEDEYVSGKKAEDSSDSADTDGSEADAGESKSDAATKQEESSDAKYMRLAADFQNFKRRTEKEKADIYAYANEKLAVDLLEVVDNFERAIAQDKNNKADEKFLEGMEMILKQLINILDKHDIKEIPALGEEFDPNLHSAMLMEASDEYESNKVTMVLQKGYKLKEKVIRPAMVKVAE